MAWFNEIVIRLKNEQTSGVMTQPKVKIYDDVDLPRNWFNTTSSIIRIIFPK